MAIDPSIGLQVQGPNIDPIGAEKNAYTLFGMQQQMQQQQAMRQAFSDPSNFGANGQPTPQMLQSLYRIDPKTAMAMQKNQADVAKNQAQTGKFQAETGKIDFEMQMKRMDHVAGAAGGVLMKYRQLVQQGMPPQQAAMMVQPMYQESIQKLQQSGMFDEGMLSKIPPQFDPQKTEAELYSALSAKEQFQVQHNKAMEENQATQRAETERHNRQTEATAKQNADTSAKRLERDMKTAHAPSGYEPNPDKPGELRPIKGGPADKSGKLAGQKIRDRMNPQMLATVEMDIAELGNSLEQMRSMNTKASPFFRDHKEGVIGGLFSRSMTPEQQQQFDVAANRVAMALAQVNSMGRGVVSDAKIREAQKLVPIAGDTRATAEYKFKQIEKLMSIAKEVLDKPAGSANNPMQDTMDAAGADTSGLDLSAGPSTGQVVNGFRYKGGDPKNQSSWEKAK